MSTLVVGNLQSDDLLPPVIKNSGGTEIGIFCRAWVNFNGTGTVAIREAFNVSSITDNGTGNYTVNFTNNMDDSDYAVAPCSRQGATGAGNAFAASAADLGPASFRITTTADGSSSTTLTDAALVMASVFR